MDVFFRDPTSYETYRDHPVLSTPIFAELFGADPALVTRSVVDALLAVKISYPRPHAQGWAGERDMHGGQLFVRLIDLELT